MVLRLPTLFMLWLLFPPLPARRNSLLPLPEPPRWKILLPLPEPPRRNKLLPLPLPLPPRLHSLLLRLAPRRGSRRPSWSSSADASWARRRSCSWRRTPTVCAGFPAALAPVWKLPRPRTYRRAPGATGGWAPLRGTVSIGANCTFVLVKVQRILTLVRRFPDQVLHEPLHR